MINNSAQKVMQPGSDHNAHLVDLHWTIASSLNQLGVQAHNSSTVPPEQHPPLSGEFDSLKEKTHLDLDIEDMKGGIRGEQRGEPSNKFLSVFLNRLKKLYPGKQIIKE